MFTLNATGAVGKLNASSLDITTGVIDFTTIGTLSGDYVIASYTSLIGTQFANVLELPTGYEINYHYNGLNEIAVAALPEPTTWTMLVGGIGMLMALQRTGRRSRR